MKKQIKKVLHLFFKGAYAIGYRENSTNKFEYLDGKKYHIIEPTLHRWYADPFPYVDGKNKYIFAEIMDDKNGEKGTIGVVDLNSNKGFIEVINEPFHMSFPNTFKYKNEVYMIPETSEAKQLRLYKAVEFPYKWELEAILYDNIQIVDTALYFVNDKVYAIGQAIPQKNNMLFEIDFHNLKAYNIEITGNYINKRPAGNFIEFSDGYYHALQESERVYGEYLHICKVKEFSKNILDEEKVFEYKVKDINHDSKKRYLRIHTYNKMNNLEVVDLLYYQFNPTIILQKILHKIRRK